MKLLGADQPTTNGFAAFKFDMLQYGYGYDTTPTSVRLSLAVIVAYCVVTVGYLLYLFVTGHTSTA